MKNLQKPKKLKIGDTVGLVSPSSPMAGLVKHRVRRGIKQLEELGFKVRLGHNSQLVTDYTAGSPKQRADDINSFFKDPAVRAIICFIGGNHSNQILKYLDFNLIKKNPKIFIGYSDATVLHMAFFTQGEMVSFYGPSVLNQFAENPKIYDYTNKYFSKATMSSKSVGRILPSEKWTDEILDWFKRADIKRPRKLKKNTGWEWIREGTTQGPIIGGCINSLMHIRSTIYWPDFSGAIFFWETPESGCDFSKGESLDLIDSYLSDLELSDVFNKIKGMVVGRPFGYSVLDKRKLKELIKEKTKDYKFPILFSVDIGHTDPMITVPLGVKVRLNSKENIFKITESGVDK